MDIKMNYSDMVNIAINTNDLKNRINTIHSVYLDCRRYYENNVNPKPVLKGTIIKRIEYEPIDPDVVMVEGRYIVVRFERISKLWYFMKAFPKELDNAIVYISLFILTEISALESLLKVQSHNLPKANG